MEDDNTGKNRGEFLPIKKKNNIIIIGILGFLIFIILFLVVIFVPLVELGFINIDSSDSLSSAPSYSSVSGSTNFWWPIGGNTRGDVDDWDPAVVEYSFVSNGIVIAHDIDDTSYNVIASKEGEVIYRGTISSDCSYSSNDDCEYGNYVMIEHNDSTVTLYGYLADNSITVFVGDTVEQGQVIGKMGTSGNATDVSLYFEVRVNGISVNPLNYINIDNPRPISSSINQISGSSNKQTVCLTLKNIGISDNGTAALLTNINHESSFNPTAEGDKVNGVYTSYGLCQWHNERKTNLITSFPDSYYTIGSQIEFLMYELENGYSSLYDSLVLGSDSVSDLTYNFCYKFERPADTKNTCNKRANSSSEFNTYVKNGCN